MKRLQSLVLTVILLCCWNFSCNPSNSVFQLNSSSNTQAWSGILLPTYGSNACNPTATSSPGQCGIDWSAAGIPGGIPSGTWTQSGSTIQASTYGNGSTDATSGIQSVLNSCGGTSSAGKYVLLSAGTFLIDGNLSIPSYCVLRGTGANQTILNSMATDSPPVNMGSGGPNCGTYSNGACSYPTTVSITAGYSAGSTSITVGSASGISAGMYLLIDQINDGTFVTNYGGEGTCSYCDYGQTSNGTRCQGQISEVESVSGTTIGISPALYVNYSNTPEAIYFSDNKYSGVENLQIYANNTHTSGDYSDITITGCAYCWVSGVEDNYTDGDHVRLYSDFHNEVVNSYFSNAFIHAPGQYDSDVVLAGKTTGCLIQNNILERLHGSTMLEWGAAGNVISYNYTLGDFDTGAPDAVMIETSTHGGHPQFNLYEGNVGSTLNPDNIWGSAANNTAFRNWLLGTTKVCNPTGGRGTVNCSGSNGWWEYQASADVTINYLDSDWNLIGNVLGSTYQANLSSQGVTSVEMVQAVCGTPPCGPNSRPYSTETYGYTFGYLTAGDAGGSAGDSLEPYTTALIHGNYSNITDTTIWASGVTQTLPKSFYLSSQPSWWPSSIPWPAIGPDVTGGIGPGGHVYSTTAANPAQYCYTAVMGGTDGTGSPLTFNADTCYSPAALPSASDRP